MPTVSAILNHGEKRLLVNCLLEELGIQGDKELITVNVANDQQVIFPSMTFFHWVREY